MGEAMTLRVQINLIVAAVALPALLLLAFVLNNTAAASARAASGREAALLTALADTTARYVTDNVEPIVTTGNQRNLVFVPAATPFYAVQVEADLLQKRIPGVTLHRVVMDPVGAADRPDAWERQMIASLRATSDPRPVTVEQRTHGGERLLLVTPLTFSRGICATCYTSRGDAPPGVLDVFGTYPGFAFHQGEIVGITVASVPLRKTSFWISIGVLLAFAFVLWSAFNIALQRCLLQPLDNVASIAEQVSLGQPSVAEFEEARSDEIGVVTRAFNRLRRSMESAIMLVDTE